MTSDKTTVSFGELFWVFLKIGLLSFGGPAAQISLMHRMLVDERKWLTEQQYLNTLGFCMMLPGPEAMQIATFAGWRLRGVAGGLLAGTLFVLPGALVIFALVTGYALWGALPLVNSLFLGVKAAVLVIVLEALLKVSKRALKATYHWVIAAVAFVGIFFLALPFPLIVLGAALYGATLGRIPSETEHTTPQLTVSPLHTLRTFVIGLMIWLVPLFLLNNAGLDPIFSDIGAFFSKLAVVTFGGAYAVLAYMAQDVVTGFGWLQAGEMMDGLGLAETTPGPLILVTQFVGFLAAFHAGGLAFGFAGGLVALWVTFAPCFIWIFAGAPYIDWISAQSRLSSALSAITAAVVGVILNLSIWFALHVFFNTVSKETFGPVTLWVPELTSFNINVLVLSLVSAWLLLIRHLGLGWVLLIAAGGGVLLTSLI
ncbi:chromate efflux transporter [Cochlodiniinecator piscidefendens]|uniref:chromate efflux transporter n=1 Tax=Cochlodiniinecator piscidefendens TaxID=2715756 RepID=UPI0014092D29|nr:chromate efflux transporter [Cochlodiniinecator piscidefendens]